MTKAEQLMREAQADIAAAKLEGTYDPRTAELRVRVRRLRETMNPKLFLCEHWKAHGQCAECEAMWPTEPECKATT